MTLFRDLKQGCQKLARAARQEFLREPVVTLYEYVPEQLARALKDRESAG